MAELATAAFFDFDKTLLLTESAAVGFRSMWRERRVSPWFLLRLMAADQLYKRGLYSAGAMAALCLRYYRGRDLRWYVDGAGEFYRRELKPHLSPAMLARLAEHRRQGHRLVLLSASVEYLLRPAADDLGFDHLLSTRLELDARGLATGRAMGPAVFGRQKLLAAEAFAARAGVDLAASWAYADHQSDAALLAAVGHPVAVRPTRQLRRVARARGWEIVERR